MAEKLTPQQAQAVWNRGGKLLVSAAAGSGKTKVLVDRILSYLKDPVNPANIDDFLIITYTKAAAAELRGKIATKLNQEIALDPTNKHLQRQLQRLYLAKISTVHAYCADVLREHAFRLDIPVDFRVMEEQESEEMQFQVIEKLLDEAYKATHFDADFQAFADTQGYGRNDIALPKLVWKLYEKNARCHMDPNKWLQWCLDALNFTEENDISQSPWADYLIADLHHYLDLQIDALTTCAERATSAEGMTKPVTILYEEIEQMRRIRACNKWDEIIANADVSFNTLRFPTKNVDPDLVARVKAVRENAKKGLLHKLSRFSDDSRQIKKDLSVTAASARGLVRFTQGFIAEYDRQKKRKRVLDFGDLEHKMLDLLVGKDRNCLTSTAIEIGNRFREVMVDEYQDSNEVQDTIFSALTFKRQNCFMVGDVKQSIYQFRQADPEIFIKKYMEYADGANAQPGEGRKVLLSSNFRSGEGVINAVNDVFTLCMSEKVGGLTYGADEKLYEGISHVSLGEPEVELYGLSVKEATYPEEAAFVAQRVAQLLDGTHMVRDGDQLRAIKPDDIAIIMRSPKSVGEHYKKALESVGIRCHVPSANNLLENEEIQTLHAILKVIDNPQQDIPMVAVLTSKVFRFTADDLAALRGQHKGSIYDSLLKDAAQKSVAFVSAISDLRKKARVCTLMGLIRNILSTTKLDSIFAAMPDGESRAENLLGFYKLAAEFDACGGKSLSKFLTHLESLDKFNISNGDEKGTAGAVTMMTIHKSKGLEFPVVILPALSKRFNTDDAREQMLCDKHLGIGLNCIDMEKGVRYPSISKRAIQAKILADNLSEEMRVLYVAMTRARDRLIMVYAAENLEKDLQNLALRMPDSSKELLTSQVSCAGEWILMTALQRSEANAFFSLCQRPDDVRIGKTPWLIDVVEAESIRKQCSSELEETEKKADANVIDKIKKTLHMDYPYKPATVTPSKQTATQIKGREKDAEAAGDTALQVRYAKYFRKPTFLGEKVSGAKRGTAMHAVMQHICYEKCSTAAQVNAELTRLAQEGFISQSDADLVSPDKVVSFFNTEIGKRIRSGENILREFKFSILEDAEKFQSGVKDEKVLVQGVVDCALIEEDGITVIDFKTDRVTYETLQGVAQGYKPQIMAYSNALQRIYNKPIKAAMLYFFEVESFVTV